MYGIYANIWGILMVNVSIYTSTMDPMGNFLAQHLGISFGESELSSGNGSTGQRHLEGPGDLHMARCGGQAAYLDMAMDQYLLNTIFCGMNIHKSQLFWCSPGVQGFDTLPYLDGESDGKLSGDQTLQLDIPSKRRCYWENHRTGNSQ